MNVGEVARWLAGIRPPPARVVAVREGKEEALSVRKGAHMWTRVANTVSSLKAEGLRCYDKDGGLIDQCQLDDDDDAPAAAATPDVLSSIEGRTFTAAEVAAILAQAQVRTVEVTANAVTRAVERAMQAASSTTQEAFKQFAEVNKTLVQRVGALEETVQDNIDRQREDLEEKREDEKSGKNMEGLMWKLFEKMGPDGLKDIAAHMGGMSNGSPAPKKVAVEATDVKKP